MSQQEINLFKSFEEPQAPKSLLNWRVFIISNSVLIFLLSFISVYSYINTIYSGRMLSRLQAQVLNLKNTFNTTKKMYPDVFFHEDVEKSVQEVSAEMQIREKILEQISNRNLFSEDMEALTQIIIPDVWLTSINIEKNGDSISLQGRSLSVEKMQIFLTRLTGHKQFINYSLSVKDIIDDTKSRLKGDLTFEITMVKNTI